MYKCNTLISNVACVFSTTHLLITCHSLFCNLIWRSPHCWISVELLHPILWNGICKCYSCHSFFLQIDNLLFWCFCLFNALISVSQTALSLLQQRSKVVIYCPCPLPSCPTLSEWNGSTVFSSLFLLEVLVYSQRPRFWCRCFFL